MLTNKEMFNNSCFNFSYVKMQTINNPTIAQDDGHGWAHTSHPNTILKWYTKEQLIIVVQA